MVAKIIENLLEKISEVVDQSKTSYMHQRNQNKKFFDSSCYGNQRKSIFLGCSLKKLPKNNSLSLYPRIPNFTLTDQIW